MSFSDDDLKKLEEGYWFKRVPIANIGQSESWVWCDGDKIVELMCRLKCAEEVAEGVAITHPEDENCGCSMCDLLKAWNRSKNNP